MASVSFPTLMTSQVSFHFQDQSTGIRTSPLPMESGSPPLTLTPRLPSMTLPFSLCVYVMIMLLLRRFSTMATPSTLSLMTPRTVQVSLRNAGVFFLLFFCQLSFSILVEDTGTLAGGPCHHSLFLEAKISFWFFFLGSRSRQITVNYPGGLFNTLSDCRYVGHQAMCEKSQKASQYRNELIHRTLKFS